MTPSVSSKGRCDVSNATEGFASSDSNACTNACTSEASPDDSKPAQAPNANGPSEPPPSSVDALAAALLALAPEQRAQLAVALLSAGKTPPSEG